MHLVVRFLSLFLSLLVIFNPTLVYAGNASGVLPSIHSLLLFNDSDDWDFSLIPGPTTYMPMFAYYRSGSQSAIFSSVLNAYHSSARSLFLDSSGNEIITYFGCDIIGYDEHPFAFKINDKVIIKVLDGGWNPDVKIFPEGQPFLILQSELPDGTFLGTAHLRAETDRIVVEIENADGETVIANVMKDPLLLEKIVGQLKWFFSLGCDYPQAFGNDLANRDQSMTSFDIFSDYDTENYTKTILRATGIALGIISLVASFPVTGGLLPTAWWILSYAGVVMDIMNFMQGQDYDSLYDKSYKEILNREGEAECALVLWGALAAALARKVNIPFDTSKCFGTLWNAASKYLDEPLYNKP